jgi:hypothetical protein
VFHGPLSSLISDCPLSLKKKPLSLGPNHSPQRSVMDGSLNLKLKSLGCGIPTWSREGAYICIVDLLKNGSDCFIAMLATPLWDCDQSR